MRTFAGSLARCGGGIQQSRQRAGLQISATFQSRAVEDARPTRNSTFANRLTPNGSQDEPVSGPQELRLALNGGARRRWSTSGYASQQRSSLIAQLDLAEHLLHVTGRE